MKLTIESFKKTTNNIKLIVIDAESQDGSVEYLHKNNIDVLKVKNNGWAYANNKAIKYAFKKYPNLDYILLLNDDLIFNENGWLKKLVNVGEKLRDVGIIGCKLKYPDGRVCNGKSYSEKFYALINIKNKNTKKGYVEAVIGAVFLIKREVIRKIGLIDEVYLPFFYEETDFCERAVRKGYKTYYVSNTNITHLERYTMKYNIKKKWTNEQITYFSLRNDWIFLFRYRKRFLLLNLIYNTVQAFIRIEPEFNIRPFREIVIRLKFNILGFIEALSMYKRFSIPIIIKNKI